MLTIHITFITDTDMGCVNHNIAILRMIHNIRFIIMEKAKLMQTDMQSLQKNQCISVFLLVSAHYEHDRPKITN